MASVRSLFTRGTPPTPTTQLLPTGPVTLDESYELCREFNKRHGTTYYWSTKVLPKIKQHHVHALYAFARYADDIVDEIPSQGGRDVPTEVRAAALADFGNRFFTDLEVGRSDDRCSRPSSTRCGRSTSTPRRSTGSCAR